MNYNNLNSKDPVALNLFSQKTMEAIAKAERRIKEKKEKEKNK